MIATVAVTRAMQNLRITTSEFREYGRASHSIGCRVRACRFTLNKGGLVETRPSHVSIILISEANLAVCVICDLTQRKSHIEYNV